jgi:hypothetical protein
MKRFAALGFVLVLASCADSLVVKTTCSFTPLLNRETQKISEMRVCHFLHENGCERTVAYRGESEQVMENWCPAADQGSDLPGEL